LLGPIGEPIGKVNTKKMRRIDAETVARFDDDERLREETLRTGRRNVRILLIRHAESEANLRHGEIGGRQNDVLLSQKGRDQAHSLGLRIRDGSLQLDEIYSSVARRAMLTATIACEAMGLPEEGIIPDERVVEQSQGSWERQPRKEVYSEEVTLTLTS